MRALVASLLGLLIGGSCSSESSPGACSIRCSAQLLCPSGMACGNDDFCHDPDDSLDCAPDAGAIPLPDAHPDTAPPDAAPAPDVVTTDARPACDGGDQNILDTNGHCYLFFTTGAIWAAARDACTAHGAHLVTVDSGSENALVYSMGVDQRTWIGAWDGVSEMQWRWISGESWGGYTNWSSGEPNNNAGDEDCAVMWTGTDPYASKWNDVPCNEAHAYVCEREP